MQTPQTRGRATAAILSSGGLASVVVAAFLPWLDQRSPWVFAGVELPVSVFYGHPFTTDHPWVSPDPGPLTSAGAVLVAIALIGAFATRAGSWIAVAAALLVLLAPALVVMTVDREPEYSVPQAVGLGLVVALIGGAALLAGGIVSLFGTRVKRTSKILTA